MENPSDRPVSVIVFACLAALLVLVSAYSTDRNGAVDEPGFLNPPYMLAHYGRLTFPTYPHNGFFDVPVLAHPPVHVMWIGLLERLGFSMYYAEATPTVILLLAAILIVVCSPFPTPVKLGWLFSIAFLAASGESLTLCFGSRPEGEIQAAWFCGLFLLEGGRIANWNRRWLAAGAMFLTWASGVHYYAGPAAAGVLVYMAWAVRSLGWKEAKPRVVAMMIGVGLFAVPYLVLYVIPHFRDIRDVIRNTVGQGGVGLSIARHMELYRNWARELYHPALVREGMATGIPLVVFSTAILAAIRSTRGIALAALPLQLGIFLLVWRKMPFYIVHESVYFSGAVVIGILMLCQLVGTRLRLTTLRGATPAAVVLLSIYLFETSPMLAAVRITFHPVVHEMEVAHAAGRQMLGPHARVGGRWWSWYASGAEHWYDVERDLGAGFLTFDPNKYLPNVDAFEVCPSRDPPGSLPAWYADGTLKLRGFYFAQADPTLRCVDLSATRTAPLIGYALWNWQLYRFQEDSGGSYETLSMVCKSPADDWHQPWTGVFAVALDIADGPDAGSRLLTVLAPRSRVAPGGDIGRSCREVARVSGTLILDDWESLLRSSRLNDPVMRFYRNIEDMPGFRGVGLSAENIAPANCAPAPVAAVDLAATMPTAGKVEHAPQVRVITAPGPGSYSAVIPLKNLDRIPSSAWISLRLRVLRGRIGFGPCRSNGVLLSRTKPIAPSPEPQTVTLQTPELRPASNIVIFNDGRQNAVVDIFGAEVLVQNAAKTHTP